jgi:hypothetical protein
MADIITKIDDNTISLEKVVPATTVTQRYDYSFLKTQRATIQADKDRYDALRDAELLEVDTLIAEAEKLGVGVKAEVVVDIVPEVVVEVPP